MLIKGEWLVCPDDVIRPIVLGEVQTGKGTWLSVPFLLDTGADRTVFSAAAATALSLPAAGEKELIGGLGGMVDSVLVGTVIQLERETGAPVSFRGQFVAITEMTALDISVLGRDITNNFAVLVDRPGDCVYLMRTHHRYSIQVG